MLDTCEACWLVWFEPLLPEGGVLPVLGALGFLLRRETVICCEGMLTWREEEEGAAEDD